MLMHKKKITKIIMFAMLVTILFSFWSMGSTVFARNNWEDVEYNFYMSGGTQYTASRRKTDTSKVYMNCRYMSNSGAYYSAFAAGTNSVGVYGGVDCSNGNYYTFRQYVSYYMTNMVNEWGYKCASVGANPSIAASFTATGVWSPDNYNKY